MITHFLKLEWKQFFRSSYFGKNIALKIIMGFFALYMIVSFLAVGAGGYFFLKKQYPDTDPLLFVNKLMIFVLIADLIFRYLMQKLPVMNIKPLLNLPIRKSKLVHYVLGKSGFSFFNTMSLFFYIPFSIVLITQGYNTLGVLGWLFLMLTLVLCNNYINFLINKNNYALSIMVLFLAGLFLSYRYQLFNVTDFFGDLFQSVYEMPVLSIIGLVLLIGLYYLNFSQLNDKVYLDAAVKNKTEEAKSSDLSFVDRLGDVAPFIKNDIRLIFRNKRTKAVFFMSFFFLLYGLLFFNVETYKESSFLIFICIFMTGGFSLNYGQFIPAWDSEHYRMLMSQNLSYRKFLESKWYLMTVMTVVLFILSTPYIYYGIDKFLMILAGFFFNIGFTSLLMIYMGSFNKKRIDLTKGGFSNMQGTSAAQFIVLIPIMIFPMLLYFVGNYFFGTNIALVIIAMVGVVSFILKKPIMDFIEKRYTKTKYATIHGFKQEL